MRQSLTGCPSSSSARDRSLSLRPQVPPSSCLSSLPALISLQHLRSTPLCSPVNLQGSRYNFASLFMQKNSLSHFVVVSVCLSVCPSDRLCFYHLHLRCISERKALHLMALTSKCGPTPLRCLGFRILFCLCSVRLCVQRSTCARNFMSRGGF